MPSSPAEAPGPTSTGSRRRGRWWWLAAALILPPVLVRGLLFEVYAIQSRSMTPTFEPGDQLLVLQPGLDGREVQRWDVIILDRAVDADVSEGVDAIIKRVAALPDEWVRIQDGDLYTKAVGETGELRLARKPDEVAGGALVPIHVGAGLEPPWVVRGDEDHDGVGEGTRLDGTAGRAEAVYEAVVRDGQLAVLPT